MSADADLQIPQRVAMDALHMWLQARDELAAPGGPQERLDAARKVIDLYLAQSGERELIDGETGRGCRLQERKGSSAYDLLWLRHQDQALFERLYETGCLAINVSALRAQEKAGQVAGMTPYEIPGRITDSLIEIGGKTS